MQMYRSKEKTCSFLFFFLDPFKRKEKPRTALEEEKNMKSWQENLDKILTLCEKNEYHPQDPEQTYEYYESRYSMDEEEMSLRQADIWFGKLKQLEKYLFN